MERWIVLSAAVLVLLGFALGAWAIVRHYQGRPVSRAYVRAAAAIVGLGSGVFAIFIVEASFAMAALLIVTASFTIDLVRRGQGIAAGLLAVLLGLPSALWWGRFVINDWLDPTFGYEPILWLWVAPGVALVVLGAFLIARGDRPTPRKRYFERMPVHVRDPAAVAHALMDDLSFAGLPIHIVVGMATAMLLAWVGVPIALNAGLPWPLVVIGGAAAFAVIGTELTYLAIPTRLRGAWQGWAMAGNPEMRRWRETVRTPIPIGTAAIRRWLTEHPETDENRWARSELLVIAGDMDGARAVIERLPTSSDWERFQRQEQALFADWVEGREVDVDAFAASAEAVGAPDSEQRWIARATAATARARVLADRGADWTRPLADLSRAAGPAQQGILRGEIRQRIYPAMTVVGVVFCAAIGFLFGLLP